MDMAADDGKTLTAPWTETWDAWMRMMCPVPPKFEASASAPPPWPFLTPYQVAEFWLDFWQRWMQLFMGAQSRPTAGAIGAPSVFPSPAAWDTWMEAWQRSWQLWSPQPSGSTRSEAPSPRPEPRGRK
jgi:hypothetical protein